MVPHPPTDVCWCIWTICSYLSLTIISLSLFLSTPFLFYKWQNCCWWSPVFFLHFCPAGSLIRSFFQRFSQIGQPFPCHKCSPQNMPVLPKHRTLPEFWHYWSCTCIPAAAISAALHCPSMFTALLPWQCWHVKQRSRQICMFECFPFLKWDITN